jgi:hypothetical protein
MFKFITSLILVFLFVGCTVSKKPIADEMCGALKEFTKAQTNAKPNSIVLETCTDCGESR